ncbi:MAG: 50S ribosomal protein L30 [Lachnospiraceae bacterium]|nr:50S ribosomal protein L30 [Lachnospiraceae bacterium]
MAENKVKVTLVRSMIGQAPKNKQIAESMGLRKIGQFTVLPDNDSTKGQIRLISHMVKVEDYKED